MSLATGALAAGAAAWLEPDADVVRPKPDATESTPIRQSQSRRSIVVIAASFHQFEMQKSKCKMKSNCDLDEAIVTGFAFQVLHFRFCISTFAFCTTTPA
ncbi:MAG: hypothetical protein ACRD2A_24540, partial [Vicinamibacterales bacterium]